MLNIAEKNKNLPGYFSGSTVMDNGITSKAAMRIRIKTLTGPTPAKTQRQLVKVDISRVRQMYCNGKVIKVKNRTRSNHSFFVR